MAYDTSGGISQWSGLPNHGRTSSASQRKAQTHRLLPRGAVGAESKAVDPLMVADSDGQPEVEVEAQKRV